MSPGTKRVVVDTDVVSFLFKGDTRAQRYERHLVDHELVISFMTLAELFRWGLSRNWGIDRRRRLEEHVSRLAVHPYDAALCRTWAELTDRAARAGRPVGVADAWIAATAILHGLPLVTHNEAHYSGVEGLTVRCERD